MSEQHNLKEQLCFSLYNAQRQVNRYYSNKVFKKYNLTYPQFLVLSILWEENKRYLNPQDYPVDLSTKCWENKHKRIFEVAEHVKEMEDENE